MADDPKTNITEMIRRTQDMVPAGLATTQQMEQFWTAQDAILDDVEDFARGWFARRHAATRSALETVREVNGNGTDPSAAMVAVTDWQRHSMERLAEDIRQWAELCARCAGRMTPASPEPSGAAEAETAGSGTGSRTGSRAGSQRAKGR